MSKLCLLIFLLVSLLLSGSAPPNNTLLQRELATLNERGVTYRMLAGNQLEVTDPRSGQKWMFDADRLQTPSTPPHDTIPTLTVDLTTIDTNLYNWRFHYRNSIELTGGWGFPLLVSDFDGNGRVEAYGARQTQSEITTRAYELSTSGSWLLKYFYGGRIGIFDKSGDVDGNGLREAYARYGDTIFVFEQAVTDSIPTRRKFDHMQWYGNATGIPNELNWMTGGVLPEMVYRGGELYTGEDRTYIVRYDSTINNFKRIWSAHLPPTCNGNNCTGAIATGDFDGDGKMEFVTSDFGDDLYVVEQVAGDSFAVTSHINLQTITGRVASGDVDGNGVEEFFVGGTQAETDGYVHLRAYAFERTGDNTYQPTFAFNIFPAGIFFVDLYQTADVDGDGIPELILSFAGGIAVFKGAGEHNYSLFYYKSVSSLDGVSAWKINNNRAATLFVSRSIGSQQIISQTDVYQLDSSLVTGVVQKAELPTELRLFQNYPNPFNPSTVISYNLPVGGYVTLKVYDVLGREVATLVDGFVQAGNHEATLNASGLSSGIYLYRMQAGNFTRVKKFVLLK